MHAECNRLFSAEKTLLITKVINVFEEIILNIDAFCYTANYLESVYVCFVDLLSLVISKKEIDISLLTVLAMVGYSSLFESMI